MEDKIKQIEKDLKDLKKMIKNQKQEDQRWKPKKGEYYYYYDDRYAIALSLEWDNDNVDNRLWSIGNCFPYTDEGKKQAERHRDRRIAIQTVTDAINRENKGEKVDWKNGNQTKYIIFYRHPKNEFDWVKNKIKMWQQTILSALLTEKSAEKIIKDYDKELRLIFNIDE